MCLITLSFRTHLPFTLAVAANRDESHTRPSATSRFWEDVPDLLAGRDLTSGGTWMGVTRSGRFAAVTNYRELPPRIGTRSRGSLVRDFLEGRDEPSAYLSTLEERGDAYGGFGLLVSDLRTLGYCSNEGHTAEIIGSGVHGLSNRELDSEWPKVHRSKERLARTLENEKDPNVVTEVLLGMLADREGAPDDELPDTGFGLERERVLAPIFVVDPVHGTRSSTVLLVEPSGAVHWTERTFSAEGSLQGTQAFQFQIETQG